jgi:hypothetical protein
MKGSAVRIRASAFSGEELPASEFRVVSEGAENATP